MKAEYIASSDNPILVTGSNGFVGVKVVKTLLEYGFAVHIEVVCGGLWADGRLADRTRRLGWVDRTWLG